MINQAQLQPPGVVQAAHDPKGELSIRYKRVVFFSSIISVSPNYACSLGLHTMYVFWDLEGLEFRCLGKRLEQGLFHVFNAITIFQYLLCLKSD
jgi:hypothetical protein